MVVQPDLCWILRETLNIMKTFPCNVNPLTPHFYKVKLEFTRVIFFFPFYALKYRSWVLVRTASRRFLRVRTINVLSKNKKNITIFYSEISVFIAMKYCCILNGYVFVMRPVFSQRGSYNYVHWIFFLLCRHS